MNSQPNSRVILITGSRKGIGRYLAEHCLSHGWMVAGCSRTASDLQHERYLHVEGDVASEADAKKVFRAIHDRFGRLDALVNNAGIASMNHALLTPLSTMEQILRTNCLGTFLFSREAAKMMRSAGSGRIVNFSTVAVPLHLAGEAAYAASKAAIVSLTQVLAREFAPFGITVNAVGPTPIETDLIKAVPKEKIDRLLDQQAIRRLGTFPDVANAVDFFLKAESDFITGQVLYLGGV